MGQKEHGTAKATVASKSAMLQKAGAGGEIILKNYFKFEERRKAQSYRVDKTA